jgi:hypothetical protein
MWYGFIYIAGITLNVDSVAHSHFFIDFGMELCYTEMIVIAFRMLMSVILK